MSGQQGHLYLSVRGRKKNQSSLSRKCGKAKRERRALRELCGPGSQGLNGSNGCCSSSFMGESFASGGGLCRATELHGRWVLPCGMVSPGPHGMPQQGCPVGQDKGWAAGHPTHACCLPASCSGLLSSIFHTHPDQTPTHGAF